MKDRVMRRKKKGKDTKISHLLLTLQVLITAMTESCQKQEPRIPSGHPWWVVGAPVLEALPVIPQDVCWQDTGRGSGTQASIQTAGSILTTHIWHPYSIFCMDRFRCHYFVFLLGNGPVNGMQTNCRLRQDSQTES